MHAFKQVPVCTLWKSSRVCVLVFVDAPVSARVRNVSAPLRTYVYVHGCRCMHG